MIGYGNIHCNVLTYPASRKGENDRLPSGLTTSFRGIALDTFTVMASHKMPRTNARIRVVEQNAVGAYRLVAMVFNDSRRAQKPSKR